MIRPKITCGFTRLKWAMTSPNACCPKPSSQDLPMTMLSEDDIKGLARGKHAHSLQWLWELLRPVALALGNAGEVEGVNFYLDYAQNEATHRN